MLDIPIKPLNLHERINTIEKEDYERLMLTKIKIGGRFTSSDAFYWISRCIPDVPPNVNIEEDENINSTLYFKSLFVGTYLII